MITIAELRARNGKMSQKKLAAEIGVSELSIIRWEKNIHTASAENIKKLSLYFGVSSDDLLGIGKKISN